MSSKRNLSPPATPMAAKKSKKAIKRTLKAHYTSVATPNPRMLYPRGCPKFMPVRLTYTDDFAITFYPTNAALGAPKVFRCNGLFDPDQSGIGGQPRFYDQWSTIYRKYTVVHSVITIKYAAELQPSAVAIASSTTAFGTAFTLKDYKEFPQNAVEHIGSTSQKTVKLHWYPNQYYVGKSIYDEALAAETSTLPIRQVYFLLGCFFQTSAAAASRNISVQIDYDTIFFDHTVPGPS